MMEWVRFVDQDPPVDGEYWYNAGVRGDEVVERMRVVYGETSWVVFFSNGSIYRPQDFGGPNRWAGPLEPPPFPEAGA